MLAHFNPYLLRGNIEELNLDVNFSGHIFTQRLLNTKLLTEFDKNLLSVEGSIGNADLYVKKILTSSLPSGLTNKASGLFMAHVSSLLAAPFRFFYS